MAVFHTGCASPTDKVELSYFHIRQKGHPVASGNFVKERNLDQRPLAKPAPAPREYIWEKHQ